MIVNFVCCVKKKKRVLLYDIIMHTPLPPSPFLISFALLLLLLFLISQLNRVIYVLDSYLKTRLEKASEGMVVCLCVCVCVCVSDRMMRLTERSIKFRVECRSRVAVGTMSPLCNFG